MNWKNKIVAILFTTAVPFIVPAQQAVLFNTNGIAIHGYDAVAFFTDSTALKGDTAFRFHWQGADWLFASHEHAAAFKAHPEKYAPQYGGYCAYGASRGYKAPTEIDTWRLKNGKLYFNYNKKVQELWLNNQDALIEKADGQWPLIKDK